ncbi:apotyrosinase chaperone MelC1 [Kitasatospora xanthocidica]|uniref:apotyrosinase chaperone MelC1 n=1 Tax=Kitasatospora xanthocidica TaxID=83382 RepID=UPI001E38807C|nr:tyrosinase cofactor [Kitasatospora xanthocidica]
MSESTTTTEITRRRMLQGTVVATAVAAGTVVLGLTGPTVTPASGADTESGDSFDEVFRNRRIQGMPMSGEGHHAMSGYMVLIDGRELHMMRNADGTWISVINHYQTFATPRALARAAVNSLDGADLAPLAA